MQIAYNEKLYPPLTIEKQNIATNLLQFMKNRYEISSSKIKRAGLSIDEFMFFLSQKNYIFHGSWANLKRDQMLSESYIFDDEKKLFTTLLPPVAMVFAIWGDRNKFSIKYPLNELNTLEDFWVEVLYIKKTFFDKLKYQVSNPGYIYVLQDHPSLILSSEKSKSPSSERIYSHSMLPNFRITIKLKDFSYPIRAIDCSKT